MLYKTYKGSGKARLRENREFIKIMAGDVFAVATSGAKAGGSGSPADIIKSVAAVAKTGLHIAQFVRKKGGARRDLKKALVDAKIAIASLDMLSPEDPEEESRFEKLFENAKLALTMWKHQGAVYPGGCCPDQKGPSEPYGYCPGKRSRMGG